MLGVFIGPRTCGGSDLQWLAQASSTVCGRSRSGRAFGPTWTGSMGRMAGSFCFLSKEEPATMPGSETFSPFFTADIRTLLFSADVLKKCALIAMHFHSGRGKRWREWLSNS